MVETTIHNTHGALLVGVCFAIFLFGIVTLQIFQYYSTFPNDRFGFQWLVGVIWILELGHTAGITYEIYTVAITRTNMDSFTGLGIALLLGGLLTMLVQGFFARRLWKLLPRPYNYIGLVCIILAVTRAVGSTFLSYQALAVSRSLTVFQAEWTWLIASLLSLGACLDVVIACAMLSFLIVQKDEASGSFGHVIDRLVGYTVRTGVFTSIAAVVVLICFQMMPGNFIWIALYAFLAKLYSNSLLAALMERRQLRNAIRETIAPEEISKASRSSVIVRRHTAGGGRPLSGPIPTMRSGRRGSSNHISIEMRSNRSGEQAYWEPLPEDEHGSGSEHAQTVTRRSSVISEYPPSPSTPQTPGRAYCRSPRSFEK